MAGAPLEWVGTFDMSILTIRYPINGLHLCAGLGQQVVVASAPDNLQHGVIWSIKDSGGEPEMEVTLRNGTMRLLGVREIYWRKTPTPGHCVPASTVVEVASDEAIRQRDLEAKPAQVN